MPRLRILVSVLCALFLSSLAIGVSSAYAAGGSITCTGTETATYNPGLQLTTRTVTLNVAAKFGPCVSSNPAISSGTAGTPPGGVSAQLSCLNVLDSSSGQSVLHWNNGTTSRYSFTRSSSTVAGQLVTTASGTVIAGEFLGRSVRTVSVSPVPNLLDCLRPGGLTRRSGVVALTII